MPTGTCKYPHHHSGSSAGPPFGLLLAIAAGALIITHVHAVLVTLAVVAALAVAGVAVVLMVHSHRAEPYDAPWRDAEPQDAPPVTVSARLLQARVDQLEQQLAERQAIAAPVTHQHLHLHGLTAEEMAEVVSHRAAIED